jgi:hypothetical protein
VQNLVNVRGDLSRVFIPSVKYLCSGKGGREPWRGGVGYDDWKNGFAKRFCGAYFKRDLFAIDRGGRNQDGYDIGLLEGTP